MEMQNTTLTQRVIAALIALALILGDGFMLFGKGCASAQTPTTPTGQDEDTVKVPYLVHRDDADALQIINSLGLARGQITYEYSDSVATGVVMSQKPSAETVVKKGTRIDLVVSKGKQPSKKVAMPDLLGKTQEEAEKALKDLKLVPVPGHPEYSNTVKPGLVCKQSVPAGVELVEGSKVTFSISMGKKTIKVPDLVGKTTDQAKEELKNAGLGVDVNTQYDDKMEADHIVKQSIAAGTEVAEGTNVTITSSLGPKPVQKVKVPDIMTYNLTDAQRTLESAGLNCVYSGDAEGTVSAVNPAVGTEVEVGSTVSITLQHVRTLVEVPDVAGMNGTEARAACDQVGLKIDYDVRQPERILIGSEPAAGTLVDMGDIIKAQYEDPKPITVEVPDVAGMDGPSASDAMRAVGLELDYNVRQPDDVLIGTDPEAGTEVEVGTMVSAVYPDPEIQTLGSWENVVGAQSLVSDEEQAIFDAVQLDARAIVVLAEQENTDDEDVPEEPTPDEDTTDDATDVTDDGTTEDGATADDTSAALDGTEVVDETDYVGDETSGDDVDGDANEATFSLASLNVPDGQKAVYAYLCESDGGWEVATIGVDYDGNVTLLGTCGIDITNVIEGSGSYDGWTVPAAPATTLVPDDAQDAFDKAYDGYVGVAFNPIATMGSQEVSGTNYLIFATGSSEGSANVVYCLTVYKDSDGNAQFTDVEQLDLGSYLSL